MEITKALEFARKYKQSKTFEPYVEGFKEYYVDIVKLLPEYKSVLDIGTGYGILPLLLEGKVSACDMNSKNTSVQMLKDAGVEYFDCNIEKTSPRGKYDLVTMTETIEHLNSNPLPAIENIKKCLNDNGYLFIATAAREIHGDTEEMNHGIKGLWNDVRGWQNIPEYKGKWKDEHTYHYDQYDLITLLRRAGFDIVNVGLLKNFSNYIIGRC